MIICSDFVKAEILVYVRGGDFSPIQGSFLCGARMMRAALETRWKILSEYQS